MAPSIMLVLVSAIPGPGFASSSSFAVPHAVTLAMTATALINARITTLVRRSTPDRVGFLTMMDPHFGVSNELAANSA
jgi:hypothetical protein